MAVSWPDPHLLAPVSLQKALMVPRELLTHAALMGWVVMVFCFLFFFLFEYILKKMSMIYIGGVVQSVLIQILVTYGM